MASGVAEIAIFFMRHLAALSWGIGTTVVTLAWVLRSGAYGIFLAVILGTYTLAALPLFSRWLEFSPFLLWGHFSVYVQFCLLIWPRPRSLAVRCFVSYPGYFTAATALLGIPWSLSLALGFSPWGLSIPALLSGVGLYQSLTTRREKVHLRLGEEMHTEGLVRVPVSRRSWSSSGSDDHLRIVQLTDPHLGPFMSEARLRSICERAVKEAPDLVLLTGDFLTMESQASAEPLMRALGPLSALPGKVFACLGNHDHEAPEIVRKALAHNGIPCLVDDERIIDTRLGPISILGADFVWTDRARHLQELCLRFPRQPSLPRLLLLHDPGAFRHVPAGTADLTLSGHTHGGHVGLLSLGIEATIVSLVARLPDQGLFARGKDRLYVHRGTGHYGFPLRVLVPAEESLLELSLPSTARAAGTC